MRLCSVETAFSLYAGACAFPVAWILAPPLESTGWLSAWQFVALMVLLALISACLASRLVPYDREQGGIYGAALVTWPIFSGVVSLGYPAIACALSADPGPHSPLAAIVGAVALFTLALPMSSFFALPTCIVGAMIFSAILAVIEKLKGGTGLRLP
ncbi:MAG TPA: hypothetical protein VMC10_23335 [Stellaceae bacterium]|nr:hypothetical protein [Stellaceae bacterium]